MPDGGEIVISTETVRLSSEKNVYGDRSLETGTYVQICVQDNGAGMDEETLNRVYEPFFSTKTQVEGAGMGLAAVYGTVKSHNGSIKAESRPNEGSIFWICLPIFAEASISEISDKVQLQKAKTTLTVLFVDDEEMIRGVATQILKRLGCTVTACCDGAEAVKYYQNHWKTVDIVILDMVMPVMNGGEAFRALKKINPDVVVLLVSGYSVEENALEIIEEGAAGFIQKPFASATFSRKIREVLGDGALPDTKWAKDRRSTVASVYSVSGDPSRFRL